MITARRGQGYNGERGIFVKTPYSQEFVEELKMTVPKQWRGWDATTKEWFIHVEGEGLLAAVLASTFKRSLRTLLGEDQRREAPPPPPPPPRQPPPRSEVARYFEILHLLESAPDEVVQAARKALAAKHHPDRGGSTEQMARINDAVDRIDCWRRTGCVREVRRRPA